MKKSNIIKKARYTKIKTNAPTADLLNKRIETICANIRTEAKQSKPNHKAISRMIDKQISLQKTLTAIYDNNHDILLECKAKQCAYTALNTIFKKTSDKLIQQQIYSVFAHPDARHTMPLAADLISIAKLAIYEAWSTTSTLSLDTYLELAFYDDVYRQFRQKNGTLSYHTPFTFALTQINSAINAHKNNKGRKTVTNTIPFQQADCITYDASGNIKDIQTFDTVDIATSHGYAMELIPLSVAVTTPDNAYYLSTEYDLTEYIEEDRHKNQMKAVLSPAEKIVYDYLQENYKQTEIADILDKSVTTINTYVRRIREKIAAIKDSDTNDYAYDYEIVRKYRV